MQYSRIVFILVFISVIYGQSTELCEKCPFQFVINAVANTNQTTSVTSRCFTIEQCQMTIITTNEHHSIYFVPNDIDQIVFSSKTELLIDYNQNNSLVTFSSKSNQQIIDRRQISVNHCHNVKTKTKRRVKDSSSSDVDSSIIVTFNSSAFIDYHYQEFLDYPLRLSVRFRTLGRISNGVLLSLTHRKSPSLIIPFIIIEHSNGKIEITILQLDERKVLSTVTAIQCGKNINNDNWHWLQFEIDQSGIFTVVVDNDSRTSQIPTYVVSSWNINALLVGDTRRLSSDIFQPFVGYMSDLMFNDEYLFQSLSKPKQARVTRYDYDSQHTVVGYRIAFFNFVTIDTPKSYIAFSERENQNKNHGKLDIYFLFRSYVPDGIILYRYAQGLNEYFAIGLRAGILALFIDFGFGKRQIVSDESTKLADGKWHEVRITRIGTDKIELVVDNRVNRSTLSANGIRNAVSLQPVLYVGGIPNNNQINLTGSGLNPHGFQGCLASFVVDGRLLDYQRALVLNGQVKMNVCSDLNKLCYDFTCVHSGICSTNDNDGPRCDCLETSYIGERCDKIPNGFYFGKHYASGSIEYVMPQTRQTEYDTITFGLQTLALSAQIFRLESDLDSYNLEYEILRGRSYIKLNMGEKQPDVYSCIVHVTDGMYHAIKVIRKLSTIELYVDGIRVKLDGGNKYTRQSDQQRSFLAQRRLRIGSFKNISIWNGIIAGLSFNRQSVFDSLSNTLIRTGDVEEVQPDDHTGLFNLVESTHYATPIISSTVLSTSSIMNNTYETTILDQTISHTTDIPMADNIFHQPAATQVNKISQLPHQTPFEWIYKKLTYFGIRGLLIGSILSICFLLFLLFLILHIHCKTRQSKKKLSHKYNQTNGSKTYSQIKGYSMASPDAYQSKKRAQKLLRFLHAKQSKPAPFRLASNGSMSRLNSGDSYHLISSIQENRKDKKKNSSYKNAISTANDNDGCIYSTLAQPIPPPSTSSSIYHQVNRLMSNPSEPSTTLTQYHSPVVPHTATLRSLKKELDNSSAQTYSAVYSCDLAANLDVEDEFFASHRSSLKRRSLSKIHPNSTEIQNQILFLYVKNLVDCYGIQPNHHQTILLATADENRIQLSHVRSGIFHSQLPISSVGACHNILFSYNGQYLIGLFYEVTSNVNPYGVKIWSTDDYSIRTNVHPIKCSIASASRHSPILYMAGKQKYGRGISLGLLDIDSCSLARELKSDPDTSIGDEIKRIILTKNELYALVACTEFTSTFTCFVVFKLEATPTPSVLSDDQSSLITGTMSNCTMILTRFNCDPNFTFSMVDSNNNGDQYILTILRTNEIIIWQLNDGEILYSYDFNYLLNDTNTNQIVDCQMNDNRLLVFTQQGFIYIWDVTIPIGQFLLIATICDPLIHSVTWLDYRHFLSIDTDGQRIRTWSVKQKEVINESISLQGTIQSLHVHSVTNHFNNQKEYFITGVSANERSLVLFEYTQLNDDISKHIVAC
ncbi:unnamed protein product [Adineta ricciae]|uniref:Uncharacterized protein n=2 Tax=Adineta ricciae TaxID=249248 RepID=A0A814J5N1_ADIRI|nr:unnamed protein product [Adineta ricciae]